MLRLGIAIALISSYLFVQFSASRLLSSQLILTPQTNNMDNSVDFELLDVDYNPLVAEFQPKPKVVVFRNQQEWDKFWSGFSFLDVNLNEQQFPVPPVNFEQKMVIGLTIGSRPKGGYGIQIERIEKLQAPTPQWLIHYTEVMPDENCTVTQQPTTPAIFILTINTKVDLQLSKQKLTSKC
jgi:hypothetical protein